MTRDGRLRIRNTSCSTLVNVPRSRRLLDWSQELASTADAHRQGFPLTIDSTDSVAQGTTL